MLSLRSFAEIAAKTVVLDVACIRCPRRGRYRLDRLIEQVGADAGVRTLVPYLIADCPRATLPGIHERCDVWFPCLLALFRPRPERARRRGSAGPGDRLRYLTAVARWMPMLP